MGALYMYHIKRRLMLLAELTHVSNALDILASFSKRSSGFPRNSDGTLKQSSLQIRQRKAIVRGFANHKE
jgi:hypothetical protein